MSTRIEVLKARIQELEEQLLSKKDEDNNSLSERLVERPSMFSGAQDDFRSFKNSINFFFKHLGGKFASSEAKASFIVRYLKGDALVWYEMAQKSNQQLVKNHEVLIKELENNFGPHVQAVAVRQELLSLKQNELSLMEFLPRFRSLAIASGVEDKMLQQLLCNAIDPVFQNEAFRALPMQTFEDYYTFLRGIALRHSAFHRENASPIPIINQINSLSEGRNCYACGRTGHLARNCRIVRRKQNPSQGYNT
ncbi:hypothetical protein HMI56_002956 [Coelomomyces lativittatus]|nr:hypothetical protein HMI56_002956 [Coelomomyces lativittatus]